MKDFFLIVCLLLIIGVSCWFGWESARRVSPVADTARVTLWDTLFYDSLTVRDSVVVKYVTRKLRLAEGVATETQQPEGETSGTDSAEVEVPITQKVYEDSTYTAWVSGYEPKLDSIAVRQRTIRETIMQPVVKKQSRFGFGVGVGAGYGLITRKPDIFVGVTFTIRLK